MPKIKKRKHAIFQTQGTDSGYDVCLVGYTRVKETKRITYSNGMTLTDTVRTLSPAIWMEEQDVLYINPQETIKLETGVQLQLHKPERIKGGWRITEVQARPRSGISLKEQTNVVLGTIDNEYTGEIGIIFTNTGSSPVSLKRGMKIAQLVFNEIIKYDEFEEVDSFEETARGSNGFGSTGI